MAHKEESNKESEKYNVAESTISELRNFVQRNSLSYEAASLIIGRQASDRIFSRKDSFPLSIFRTRELGALEAIAKYLKENAGLSIAEISRLTGRSIKTIWTAYRKASQKMPALFSAEGSEMRIPAEILLDRSLGVQENIVFYLKETAGMSYHQIAAALKRNDRTVWTAYKRAKRKKDETNT